MTHLYTYSGFVDVKWKDCCNWAVDSAVNQFHPLLKVYLILSKKKKNEQSNMISMM